jgi:hypothetical protein
MKRFGIKVFQGLDQTPFEDAEEPRSPKGLFYGGAGSRAMLTGEILHFQSNLSHRWSEESVRLDKA